jgi:hypothetical protein
MNSGLYLPLLVALAFCQHLSQRQANDVGRLLLSAAATGLACLISLLLGTLLLDMAGQLNSSSHALWPALLVGTVCPLLLNALLQVAAAQTRWLGLRWYWLWLDNLLLGLPLFCADIPAGTLAASLLPLLPVLLFSLLLAQFATLPQRLARCNLPAALRGQPALLACALLLALALHRLGAHLS